MKAMKIDEYLELTTIARLYCDVNGRPAGELPAFPTTEEGAAEILTSCGYKGAYAILEHLREDGKVTAAKDSWGREAVEAAAAYMERIDAFNFDVFACYGWGVPYALFMGSYLSACGLTRKEFPWVASTGLFGGINGTDLVSFDYFVKTVYPPRGERPGRVIFTLADDIREELEAEKAARAQA